MRKTLITTGLVALLLARSAEAVTLEIGLNGNFQKVKPLVGVSQELFKKGNVQVSGRVEKEIGKDMALQAWATGDLWNGYSLTGSFKEGIDENSDPFNPGYVMPAVEVGKRFGAIYVGAGGRVYFPKEKEYDIQATIAASCKLGNFSVKLTPVIPVEHPENTSAKLNFNYNLK